MNGVLGLDHLQISIPTGQLELALDFYVGALGFTRIPKPASLNQRGAWLSAPGVQLHLGEQTPFATDGKAHPALRVTDVDALVASVTALGLPHRVEKGLDGCRRISVFDPFGNRIELMQYLDM